MFIDWIFVYQNLLFGTHGVKQIAHTDQNPKQKTKTKLHILYMKSHSMLAFKSGCLYRLAVQGKDQISIQIIRCHLTIACRASFVCTYFFNSRRICASLAVGNMVLILATAASVSACVMNDVS